MNTQLRDSGRYCGYCGHPIRDDVSGTPERFGERFCSEAHAEDFAAGVRAARLQAAAARPAVPAAATCAMVPPAQRSWGDVAKRAACWGAPVLLLLAIPLLWTGGWAAAGGSVLSAVALLACPLGMYFMMRGMMNMQRHDPPESERRKEGDGRA
jgi:hypothetical protein